MSSADLFEDGFPHSTKEGYKAGCRGRACPGIEDNGISCADAYARYQGDYGFRKKVDAGMTPSEIMAAEAAPVAEKPRPKPKAAPKPTVQPLSAEARAAVESEAAAAENSAQEAPEPEPTKEIPLENHGTTKGYKAGCRLRDKCPGIETVGKSCTQAIAEYQRDAKAAKKRDLAAVAPTKVDPAVEAEALAVEVAPLIGEVLVDVDDAPEEPADALPQETDERLEATPSADELLAKIAELERQLDNARRAALEAALEANRAAQPSTATFADGTRVTVTVTIDRAA